MEEIELMIDPQISTSFNIIIAIIQFPLSVLLHLLSLHGKSMRTKQFPHQIIGQDVTKKKNHRYYL